LASWAERRHHNNLLAPPKARDINSTGLGTAYSQQILQESRAAARKPRDAASILFG